MPSLVKVERSVTRGGIDGVVVGELGGGKVFIPVFMVGGHVGAKDVL
jgi:hypothetical protein